MKGLLTFLAIMSCLLSAQAQVPPTRADFINQYIDTYKELAIAEMQRTGVPASIKLAQGILETEAGRSNLVLRSNNHFGIKCKSYWTGRKVYHDDDAKGECFRAYPSAEDSWRDHSDYLKATPRYTSLFQLSPDDYKGWAYGLKAAGYATNPKYPQILIRYIEEYKLNEYSLLALGKKQPQPIRENRFVGTAVHSNGLKESALLAAASRSSVKTYPTGLFTINRTPVRYLPKGSSLRTLAIEENISLSVLLEYNELRQDDEVLKQDQLVFLRRKPDTGEQDVYVVEEEEDMYQIAQRLGIRLESLLGLNQVTMNMKPAIGEKIYLQKPRTGRVRLANSK